MNLNVRGFNSVIKKSNLNDTLTNTATDIAILTETWLKSKCTISIDTDDYYFVKSPPSAHQGVAIALNRKTFNQIKIMH